MALSSKIIYNMGLMLIGFSFVLAAIIVPIFLIASKRIRKRLEDEYGRIDRHDKR